MDTVDAGALGPGISSSGSNFYPRSRDPEVAFGQRESRRAVRLILESPSRPRQVNRSELPTDAELLPVYTSAARNRAAGTMRTPSSTTSRSPVRVTWYAHGIFSRSL